MDGNIRQALSQPAAQDALRDALKSDETQEALRAFLQARQNLLTAVLPALAPHGVRSVTDANPVVTASVDAARASGKELTAEQVSEWIQQQYGVVPTALSAG